MPSPDTVPESARGPWLIGPSGALAPYIDAAEKVIGARLSRASRRSRFHRPAETCLGCCAEIARLSLMLLALRLLMRWVTWRHDIPAAVQREIWEQAQRNPWR